MRHKTRIVEMIYPSDLTFSTQDTTTKIKGQTKVQEEIPTTQKPQRQESRIYNELLEINKTGTNNKKLEAI